MVAIASLLAVRAGRCAWIRLQWAKPVERPGLPNLHRVSRELYRGAAPDRTGLDELKTMGVRTVIDLAGFPGEREQAVAAGLEYVEIPITAYRAPDWAVAKFVTIMKDKQRGPFFVHCAQGTYRTGTMVAVYRIVLQGWTRSEAADEMAQGDFGFARNYSDLLKYLEGLDVERINREAGL